jgi:hypothetical protein
MVTVDLEGAVAVVDDVLRSGWQQQKKFVTVQKDLLKVRNKKNKC